MGGIWCLANCVTRWCSTRCGPDVTRIAVPAPGTAPPGSLRRREAEGALELCFCRGPRGRSALRSRRQRFPLRMTAPLYLDAAAPDMAFVYIQNPTGGAFAGDRLRTSVTVDPGVRLHVTS